LNLIESSDPSTFAAQLVAIELISELLVSTTPVKLSEALTNQLRELCGAKTVMVCVHRLDAGTDLLLHVSPLRRFNLFSPQELDLLCQQGPDEFSCSCRELPPDHCFKSLLTRAGVETMARFRLRAGGELVGALLLFDLPGIERLAETNHIIRILSSPIALALKNSLAHAQIEQLALGLEKRVEERTQELQRKNEELRQSEERHRTILHTAMDGFWLINAERRILEANEAYCQMSGYSCQELQGMNLLDLSVVDSEAEGVARAEHIEKQRGNIRFESIHRRKDGSLFNVDVSITYLPLDGGRFAVFLHDITERKRSEQQIQELAYFDGLTKLPNRRLMIDRLRRAMIANSRSKMNGALLFVDLDHFKTLNDTYGHGEGDLLLQQVANRFTATVREGDTVARLGGDEFIVILEGLSESPLEAADQVKNIGQKILAAFQTPFALTAREYRSTASIGTVLFKDAPDNLDELMKLADIAMYQAKAAGRNTLCFFDPVVQAIVKDHAVMEEDLRCAIAGGELLLYFQPQMNGRTVTGAEALIRWMHPKRGLVMPGEFIPLAEETDLILLVGAWVLEEACRQIVAWESRPQTRSLMVAVNVSARQFRQADFVARVLDVLDRSGANPRRLKLELTESMLVHDVEDVIVKMNALKERGLSFSLDDFGTGYSSLSYLSRLPIDQLKIDQSFVRHLLTDRHCGAISQTVVALGKTLGLSVIAEGVETEEQRAFLENIGCLGYQGYLFCRPVPADQFVEHCLRAE
jgi:diguanylate cyclase (GGDEF)-like protein/PAS domain S-box-containing protein